MPGSVNTEWSNIMNHISEDKLLEYSLELIEDKQALDDIEKHIHGCSKCRERLSKIREDVDVIGGVRVESESMPSFITRRGNRNSFVLFKVAAILIVGFLLGYSTSNWLSKESTSIVASQLRTSPPPDSIIGIAASDGTEIKID